MKKLLSILVLTLALNFLAAVGGIAYLFQTGALSRDKVTAIKAVVFPATTQAAAEEKKDTPDATTQPTIKLEELLASASGRPAGEQVEFMQRRFDALMAQLDRRQRELAAQEETIAKAKSALSDDRTRLAAQQKRLDDREQVALKQAADKGFQDTMALYDSLQPRQVKDIFQKLDDETAMKYLRAMEPARAGKILKEFKTPPETERVQKLMEMIRLQPAVAKDDGVAKLR